MHRVLAVVLLTLTLTACGRPAAPPSATSTHTIVVGGVSRDYRLHRPAGLTGPAPLVLVLHGGFGSAAQAERAYGWDAEADREHFLVAYPDGIDRAWNSGGGCCGRPGRSGVDDGAFASQVVSDVDGADRDRVYATGISNGGMMAYRLACQTAVFAAIAPDSATLLGDCPNPGPVSVLHLHGTADHNIPYDGSPGTGVAHIDGPPVPDLVARWRAVDHCPAPTSSTTGSTTGGTTGGTTTTTAQCPGGRTVELITIAGGGHEWPAGATGTIWRFFAGRTR